jgi:glycosyltransferase involved in cell wall biosynthesis
LVAQARKCGDYLMRVMVLGMRGFPGVEGGVENHAEHLYPLLVQKGCQIQAIVRRPYVADEIGESWQGVQLHRLWAPSTRIPGIEAFIHSLIGVFYAALKKPDILHIHSIGPALFCPFARLLGLRVVVTYHTQDYVREKWGLIGRLILLIGESLAVQFSHVCIVISRLLQERVYNKFHYSCVVIPNGVKVFEPVPAGETLSEFGLEPRRYVLMVGRFDPGKRHLDLIRAFNESGLQGWKLVLVGGTESTDQYTRRVIEESTTAPGVVLTGFQAGNALRELYSNAGIFVLPSSHEGLPVVLLEALSFGLPAIASDIPANLEIGLPAAQYFPLGNVSALARRLQQFSSVDFDDAWRSHLRVEIKEKYDWEGIANQTLRVYSHVLKGRGPENRNRSPHMVSYLHF